MSLDETLRSAGTILLDFDGPVCSVFAGFPAREVAASLRASISKNIDSMPDSWITETDPLALLRRIEADRQDLTSLADSVLGELESDAAKIGRETPGGESFLRACQQTSRDVWIVSNNAGAAISAYLAAHGLTPFVAGVLGRRPGDPSSMKPNPRLLLDAMEAADAPAAQCLFVGDAVRDVEAGTAAGMGTIGYANKPHKFEALASAGAVAITGSMEELATAVLRVGPAT